MKWCKNCIIFLNMIFLIISSKLIYRFLILLFLDTAWKFFSKMYLLNMIKSLLILKWTPITDLVMCMKRSKVILCKKILKLLFKTLTTQDLVLLWWIALKESPIYTFQVTLLLMLLCLMSLETEVKCGTKTTNWKTLLLWFLIDHILEFTKLLLKTVKLTANLTTLLLGTSVT